MSQDSQQFLEYVSQALEHKTLQRIIFSQYQGKSEQLNKIVGRLIQLEQEWHLSLLYHYAQRDVTKNYKIEESFAILEQLFNEVKQVNLFTLDAEIQLKKGKKSSRLLVKKNKETQQLMTQHNREKVRYIEQNSEFLQHLGITDANQNIIPSMAKKWKQINKFVEIVSGVFETSSPLNIVDFGSGKGYLTFALYDYLKRIGQEPQMVGVELRHHLVEFCQKVSQEVGFDQLSFYEGDVRSYQPERLDVMIALHACDTATDIAIHTGIRLNAQVIVCSPCCHKELRSQLQSPPILQPMLQFGIHTGQQAEMLTDTIRALYLKAYGYETKVFEFIGLESTSKNKMILAVKKSKTNATNTKVLQQIEELMQFYGIKSQTLKDLLTDIQQ